jgi:hypothetical protein
VSRIAELRNKAALCRRVASVPTKGGHHDRVLLTVAAELDREAEELDGGCTTGYHLPSGR